MSLKKTLLVMAIGLSLAAAGHRFYKFYYEHYPLAEPGECLALQEDAQARILVLENDNVKGICTALMEVDMGFMIIKFPGKVSYKDLRDAKVKKVKCHEEAR